MAYVDSLIPQEHKVLPEYFNVKRDDVKRNNEVSDGVFLVISVAILLFAGFNYRHLLVPAVALSAAFIVFPATSKWLENNLQFRLTDVIKTAVLLAATAVIVPLHVNYKRSEEKLAIAIAKENELRQKEDARLEKEAKIRNDSIAFYLQSADNKFNKSQYDKALHDLSKSLLHSLAEPKEEERKRLRFSILKKQADINLQTKQFRQAIPLLSELLSENNSNPELRYMRGYCYSKIKEIQNAVTDLKVAIELGEPRAESLHNKVNPIKRRIAYYVTRCWDGTTSNAKGRGACSHHGGVKNWNEPVYEAYRVY